MFPERLLATGAGQVPGAGQCKTVCWNSTSGRPPASYMLLETFWHLDPPPLQNVSQSIGCYYIAENNIITKDLLLFSN